MGKSILIACFAALLMAAVAFAQSTQSHSVEMGNMDCITCHSDKDMVSKPNVVSEWQKGVHSYAGVSCGNCHGDAKDFAPRPRAELCASCHTEQVAEVNSVMPCERCHTAHTFNVHGK
jgi:hypothetical protein